MNLSRVLIESGFFWQDQTKGFNWIDDRVLALWYQMPNPEVAEAELVQLAKSLLRQDSVQGTDPSSRGHFVLYTDVSPRTVHVHFVTCEPDLKPAFRLTEGVH